MENATKSDFTTVWFWTQFIIRLDKKSARFAETEFLPPMENVTKNTNAKSPTVTSVKEEPRTLENVSDAKKDSLCNKILLETYV